MAHKPIDFSLDDFSKVLVPICEYNGHQLSLQELALFLTCYPREGLFSRNALAKELNILTAAVQWTLEGLERYGLITCMKDPEDRQGVFIGITSAGRAYMEAVRDILDEVIKKKPAKT